MKGVTTMIEICCDKDSSKKAETANLPNSTNLITRDWDSDISSMIDVKKKKSQG